MLGVPELPVSGLTDGEGSGGRGKTDGYFKHWQARPGHPLSCLVRRGPHSALRQGGARRPAVLCCTHYTRAVLTVIWVRGAVRAALRHAMSPRITHNAPVKDK